MLNATTADQLDPASLWPVQLDVTVQAPYLYGGAAVHLPVWRNLNYLVGPNGSGKTTVFNRVMNAARQKWPTAVKVLGTGRLGTMEKSIVRFYGDRFHSLLTEENISTVYQSQFQDGYDTAHDAFLILEKRLDLRLQVTAFLQHVFNRDIHLRSTRQGLRVFTSRRGSTTEYSVLDECHGLKELITVLTFLYDDRFKIIGIDEPELHLHPQFQKFLHHELRKQTENPDPEKRKIVFLVTHSPILIELRRVEDLASLLMFSSPERQPTRLNLVGTNDEARMRLRRAVPSIHSAQREAFFARTPIFVEGPSDLAVVSAIASRLDLPIGPAGIGLAQMGGKNQLLAFRTLMSAFQIDAHFILDLDVAFDAKLLHEIENDAAIVSALAQAGSGTRTLSQEVGELRGLVQTLLAQLRAAGNPLPHPDFVGADLAADDWKTPSGASLVFRICNAATTAELDRAGVGDLHRAICGKVDLIVGVCRHARLLILKRGPIEAYYSSPPTLQAKEFRKQEALERELEGLFSAFDLEAIASRYEPIIAFIKSAGTQEVPLRGIAATHIADMVHEIQKQISLGTLTSPDELTGLVVFQTRGFSEIATVSELIIEGPQKFQGTINLKAELGGGAFRFNQDTKAFEIVHSS